MVRRRVVADYVIAGAGASGLGFADVVLAESDRTVAIVDRQARPGGHWNHAYPFIRLHGPSANYGVTSKPLGSDTVDESGTNAGFYELATGSEVVTYFEGLVRDQFLPSGRVTYLPMHDVRENGTAASMLTGEIVDLVATRKFVDATYLAATVPSMREHSPNFTVADGTRVVTPSELAEVAAPAAGYVVIGAGKTSADVCLWLLERGVDADRITWVRPRDPWFLSRARVQPGTRFAQLTFGGYAAMLEAAAAADSVDDLARRYEEADVFLRLDEGHWPTFYRGATVAPAELQSLRAVTDVVRLGYVRHVEDGEVVLTEGTVRTGPDRLFVDCTAEGLRRRPPVPFFSDGRVTLQYALNGGQPAYSAALAGIVELALDNDEDKNAHLRPTSITSELDDLARNFLIELDNQAAWSGNETIQGWIDRCRLNPARDGLASLDPGDDVLMGILTRVLAGRPRASENLGRLVARS